MKLGLLIFLSLVITGGIAGYLGDYIGRKVGRKKLKILSLRPRHSAYMLTVLSGILLAGLIFGVINIFSAVRLNFTNLAFIETLPDTKKLTLKQSDTKNNASVFIADAQNKPVIVESPIINPTNLPYPEKQPDTYTQPVNEQPYNYSYNYTRHKKNPLPVNTQNKTETIAYEGDILINAKISGSQSSETAKSIMTQLLDITNQQVTKLGAKNNDNLLLSSSEVDSTIDSIQKEGDYLVQITTAKNSTNNNPIPVRIILKKQESQENNFLKEENTVSKNLADFLEKERIRGSIAQEEITRSVKTAIDKIIPDKIDMTKTLPSESYTKVVQSMPVSSPDSQVQLVIQKNKDSQKTLEVEVKTFKLRP